jgi:hypothetical protein
MKLVVLGLTLSSSWGNGHATTYRALLAAFARRGHEVLFLERDKPWYASNRDLAEPDFCTLACYDSLDELTRWRTAIAGADAVIVGSYVPEGIAVGDIVQREANGVTAFYDIDTPVTLAALERGDCDYLSPELIPGFDLYLSFTGGPTLDRLEQSHRWRPARRDHVGARHVQREPRGGVEGGMIRRRQMVDPLDIGGPGDVAGILRTGDGEAPLGASVRRRDQQPFESRLAIGAVGAEIAQVPSRPLRQRAVGLGVDRAVERARHR